MNKAIIIDDELHCIETLTEKIKLYCPAIEIVATFSLPHLAVEYLETNSLDIVFLDIEMPKINGFLLLEQLKVINFKVIFTTAYDQYAIKAIKFSAFDYLLKPIDKDDLVLVAERMQSTKPHQQIDEQINVLLQQIKNTNQEQLKIGIPTSDGVIFPYIRDIVRVESSSNYSTLYFTSGKKVLISRTLKDFEEMLTSHHFYRVHNSHLINMKLISRVNKTDGGFVEFENGDKVEISRRRKEEFLNLLNLKA